ncbi:diguanylate cyclase (GGDEF) domain-containing protein [Eubacterium uniforme]|uniref:Diguanylate cyclase (GGDEF) domain-containing protein n=1 Tax=Eubacterium uniforme TaxID=39495 RepID=A0A1T4VYG8_9FIRM|nr:bifunctional diguanylate cyclase/phosphodiesterase [Eubacterium uniforme]SKA69977.1 diguanylate cyclase (GGDEF) domain-containing protein [Eubacterium uniforme]
MNQNIKQKYTERVINRLSEQHKKPTIFFIVIVLLYITSTVLTSAAAAHSVSFNLFGVAIPVYTFAGALSAISEICIIFMAFYFGKLGYFTAIALQFIQVQSIIFGIVRRHNITSIPGLFSSVLTIIAISIIYLNNKKIDIYQKELRRQAITDGLTGLPNRYACSELIDNLYSKKEKYIITSIDINGFKGINDTLGFDIGNSVLKEIANRWITLADTNDKKSSDFIARVSGDEFVIIIRNYASQDQALNKIKEYEKKLTERITIDDCDIYVNASFGYAEYPLDSDEKDFVYTCAETAMHEVKRRNISNHILHFTPDMLTDEHLLEIEGKIKKALEEQTFFFHLQPQFNMDHKLRGFEALARMKDSDGAFISPGEFIPVAEKIGLIDKVDEMIFRKSALFFGKLLKESGADITLSINVSVKHLMKNDFLDEIQRILDESGVPATNLEIEITESIMIDSVDKALECIDKIRAMGIQIAIDDFGTGYSSLSYLNKFPANLLKIDKSFIDTMNTSKSSKQYVSAIISMGHIMGFDVISEGVEEDAQIETLKEIGCDFIQGYIWGRPLPQEEAEKLVLSMF